MCSMSIRLAPVRSSACIHDNMSWSRSRLARLGVGGGRGGALALRFNRTGVLNATGPLSVTTQTRNQHHDLPEVAPAVPWTPSAPDATGPSNRAGQPSRLGPATGGVRSTVSATSGMGLVIRVTLWAHGCVVGRNMAFPLAVRFGGVGATTGATVW